MELRDFTAAELPALLELCRRSLPAERWTLDLLRRRVLEAPGYVPAYQVCAWDGDRLAGALLGTTREMGDGLVAGVLLAAVDPAYRGQGIATQLLGELERRVRAAGIGRLRVGHIAPDYLWPGLDVRYTPALCWLQRNGFQLAGQTYNMEADLTAEDWDTAADAERLAREGWQIRRLLPEDRDAFEVWLRAEWNPGWLYEGLAAYRNDPISAFIATHAGQIRAFACHNVSGFENSFGPIGTDHTTRGLGVGRVLLRRCMADQRVLGHDRSEICWIGPIAFYARGVGANISRTCWFLEKELS
jgi:mycothiol synthase